MVALSLNIQQRVHPVIWTVNSLPFDCIQAIPINKPIGGCLVMCVNSLIYLNQSVPPYGVSLNSSADHSTSFPLSKYRRKTLVVGTRNRTYPIPVSCSESIPETIPMLEPIPIPESILELIPMPEPELISIP